MPSARRIALSAVLGIVPVVLFGTPGAGAQDTAQLSAPEILLRTADAYAHCTSYQDTGVVRIVYLEATGRRTEERPFKTAFVRPDRFRFEYEESGFGGTRRYIVWRLGSRVRTWWDVEPGIEEKESLDSALAGATGVSGGSAHAVPALLLPGEVTGRRLTEMTDARRLADVDVGGAGCYRIEGKYAGLPRTVCVDRRTFLVRKIEFETTFPTFRTQETTTYEPVADQPVGQASLEFAPPGPK